MNLRFFSFLLMAAAFSNSPAEAVPGGWSSVEKIMGRAGQEREGGFLVEIPRADLNVTVQGIPLEPELALTSRFFFRPMEKGTLLSGEVVLLESEVPRVEAEMTQNGFQPLGVQDFLPNGYPSLRILYISGQGSRANLAQALRRVLTAKPLSENREEPAPRQAPTPTPAAPAPSPAIVWAGVESVLGPGKLLGKVLSYEIEPAAAGTPESPGTPFGVGLETVLRLQKVQGVVVGKKKGWGWGSAISKDIVAGTGRMLLDEGRAEEVKDRLERRGLWVAKPRNPDGNARQVWLYFWVLGPSTEAAETLQEVWKRMEGVKSK